MSSPQCHALVPCAGSGSRSGAGRPKQYVSVAGRPLVLHTLAALLAVPQLNTVSVVVSPTDTEMDGLLEEAGWQEHRAAQRVRIVPAGGATRAHTVLGGLQALLASGAHENDWVLVHDAARCMIRPQWVERLINACSGDEVGGLLALPLPDTLKRSHPSNGALAQEGLRVEATLEREGVWAAQTPQMFALGTLLRALQQALAASVPITDEASAIEHLGLKPLLVRGDYENFKVTYESDFALADRLLRSPL